MKKISGIILFLALISASSSAVIRCPVADPVRYLDCHCGPSNIGNLLHCSGNLTQKSLDNFLTDIYTLNNPTADPNVVPEIPVLRILQTNLTSLNLTKFVGFNFGTLHVSYNSELRQVTGPSSSANVHNLPLRVKDLIFVQNNATTLGLNEFFETVQGLETIEVHYNYLNKDFLSFTDTLEDIQVLNVQANDLGHIPAEFLGAARKIREVGLDGNHLSMVAARAFQLPVDQEETGPLKLSLGYNWLNDASFSQFSGLDGLRRVTHLNLRANHFEFLSSRNFQGFLEAHSNNSMDLEYNYFVCDSRMSWLKDGREGYEHRVLGVNCQNDPGHTIFTTDLV